MENIDRLFIIAFFIILAYLVVENKPIAIQTKQSEIITKLNNLSDRVNTLELNDDVVNDGER